MFDSAVAAASPALGVPPKLPPPTAGRAVVVGTGKAVAAMAQAVEAHWPVGKLIGDTDGIHGTQDKAGALLGPDTLARAAASGLSASASLADNDGYGFFFCSRRSCRRRAGFVQRERFSRGVGGAKQDLLF